MSLIQVSESGKLEIEADHFSVLVAQGLIADGHLVTTPGNVLVVTSIVVPEFFGRTNVASRRSAPCPRQRRFC